MSTFGEAKVTKKNRKSLEVRKIMRTFATFFETAFPFVKRFYLKFIISKDILVIVLCIRKKN